jgi:hypothetical protein
MLPSLLAFAKKTQTRLPGSYEPLERRLREADSSQHPSFLAGSVDHLVRRRTIS